MATIVVREEDIKEHVALLVQRANRFLPLDVYQALKDARQRERNRGARLIFDILLENACLAQRSALPICQDTGIDVVFVEIGQDCVLEADLVAAINQGIALGTREGYLRNSVCDPVTRENTGDNTPGVIHVTTSPRPGFKIGILPKGCGSENMSALRMLPPSAGMDGVCDFVLEQVKAAGPNPCPPGMVGVGIGGTMEQAAILSKKALLRPIGSYNARSDLAELEKRFLSEINGLGIGPQGLGGDITTLFAAVEAFPCHIASLPVAVNIQCHAARRAQVHFTGEKWEFIEDVHEAGEVSGALSSLLSLAKPLELPLSRQAISELRAGDWVKLSGKMFTGRDQTHRRLCMLLDQAKPLPLDLANQFIYYVGPSPAPPGKVIGAAGPTTSYRMDAYTPRILSQGVLGLMGKGKRSAEVVEAIKRHGAVYMATIGGAGAFLSGCIKACRLVAFEDLGPEALFELEVQDFPAIVINDPEGNDYYNMLRPG